MPSDDDHAFGELVIEKGYVTREQVDESLENQSAMAEMGVVQTLGEVMVSKELLSRELQGQVLREVQRRSGRHKTIGSYELIAKLGEGGMGAVYRAKVQETGAVIALKVLAKALASDKSFVARFHREAELASGLDHPNIVRAIRSGESGGHHYFAMEYVEGENVGELLRREGVIPEGEALRIVRDVALALEHAHGSRLVHRDIKPDNIFLTPEGTAKLGDMGLAKVTDQEATRLTQSGMMVGTPHYISPEQVRGAEDLDTRCDIYSLGATLYHMMTGRTPFEGSSVLEVVNKHLTEELPWPADVNDDLTDDVCFLVQRMMAKAPEDRYQEPLDLIQDIDTVIRGQAPDTAVLDVGKSSIRKALKVRKVADAAERRRRRLEADAHRGPRRAGSIVRAPGPRAAGTNWAFVWGGVAAGVVMLIVAAIIATSGPKEPKSLPPIAVRRPKGRAGRGSRPRHGSDRRPERAEPTPDGRTPGIEADTGSTDASPASFREQGAASMLADIRKRWESGKLGRFDAHREIDRLFDRYPNTKALAEAEHLRLAIPQPTPGAGMWHVVSGFSNAARAGFGAVYPPEETIDLKAAYALPDGSKAKWALVKAPGATCDLTRINNRTNIVYYAFAFLVSAADQDVTIFTNSDDGIKVWLNGDVVVAENVYRGITHQPDRATKVRLKKGLNPVLVKVTQLSGPAALKLYVTGNEAEVIRAAKDPDDPAVYWALRALSDHLAQKRQKGPEPSGAAGIDPATAQVPRATMTGERLEALLDEFDRLALGGRYEEAQRLVASAKKEAGLSSFASVLATAGKVLDELVAAEKLREGGLADAVGKKIHISVGGIRRACKIVGLYDGGFLVEREVRMGPRRTTVTTRARFEDIEPWEMKNLRGSYRPTTPDGHIAVAIEAMAKKDLKAAKASLASAGEHPLVARYLSKLEPKVAKVPVPEAAPAPFVQDSGPDGVVSIEAESYHVSTDRGDRGWELSAKAGQSGAGCMMVPDLNIPGADHWSQNPMLSYRASFVKTGRHYVWVRGAGPDGKGDSVHVGLNGQLPDRGGAVSGFGSAWGWMRDRFRTSGHAYLDIPSAGVHTINVWMREDGFVFDKLVLTANQAYSPSDAGPIESRRVGAGPAATAETPADAGGSDAKDGWISVFNGRDLTGWTKFGVGKAYVKEGALVSEGGADLYCPADWTEFILEFEIKSKAGRSSSVAGIGLSQSGKTRRLTRLSASFKSDGDLHIMYGRTMLWRSGALFDISEWTSIRLEITQHGLKVFRHGELLGTADVSRVPLARGGIGFFSKSDNTVSLRNVSVQVISRDLEGWRTIFNGRDMTGWKSEGGKALVEDKALVSTDGADIWFPAKWEEYELDCEVKSDRSGVVIALGQTNFGRGLNRVQLRIHNDGDAHCAKWKSGPGKFPIGDWFHLRLRLTEEKLEIYRGSTLATTVDLSQVQSRPGGIYFYGWGGAGIAMMRRIRVRFPAPGKR